MSRHMARLQRTIAETPFEIPIAVYFGCVGIASIASGTGIVPTTIDRNLPIWLVFAWTAGLAIGGVLTVLGRIIAADRCEAAGLILLGYGATLYAAVLLVAGDFPITLTAASAMIAIATGCWIRLHVLTVSHRARAVATEIIGDEGRSE